MHWRLSPGKPLPGMVPLLKPQTQTTMVHEPGAAHLPDFQNIMEIEAKHGAVSHRASQAHEKPAASTAFVLLLAQFVLCVALFAVQGEALAAWNKYPVDVLRDEAPTLCQTVRAIEKPGRSKAPRAIDELLKHLDSKCDELPMP